MIAISNAPDELDKLLDGVTPDNIHGETVVHFRPVLVGDAYRLDPDEVLEEAKGKQLESVVIIGEQPDGELWVSSCTNAGVSLVMIERAKHRIVFGE